MSCIGHTVIDWKRLATSRWCRGVGLGVLLLALCVGARAEKPDPTPIGGKPNPPALGGKADPTPLGVMELSPELIQRFTDKYNKDFGPPVAIEAFVRNVAGERAEPVDTRLLSAQVRRVWTQTVPDVEMVSVEADQLNQMQKALTLKDNDPAGFMRALQLDNAAELVLVIECFPNKAGQQDFDVVFTLYNTVKGNEIAAGRGVWFKAGDPQSTEILARAITRDVWEAYAPANAPAIRMRRFDITITGLPDRAAAQALADELAVGMDTPVRLANFSQGRDVTNARLQIRIAGEVGDVANEVAAAAEFAGVKLAIDSARGTDIVANVQADAGKNLEWYLKWKLERDPRRFRILSGWSLGENRPNGGIGQLTNKDLTGADFMNALTNGMIGNLAPITNESLADLQDAALINAAGKADEAALTELLTARYPDEVIWLVSARPVKNGEEVFIRTTVMIVDTLSAQTLAVFNDDYLKGFDERAIQGKADEYVARGIEGLMRVADQPVTRQTLLISGLESAIDRDMLVDAIATKLPNGANDVKIRESIQNDVAGEAGVEIDVKTSLDPAGVSRLVRRAIFDELGWPVHEYRLNPAIILRVKNALEIPEWAMLTGDPDEAGDLLTRVNAVLGERGNPSILTLIQADEKAVDDGVLQTMQTSLNDYLANAGVNVIDSAVGVELAQRYRYRSEFQDDFSLAAVLREQVRAEWLLVGYVRQTNEGLAGNYRLIDLRRVGQFLVGVNVPDLDSKASRKVKVDRKEPASIARFVAGRTLGGLLRLEGQPHRLEVVVVGAKSGDQVTALAQQLSTNIPAVCSVEGLYFTPEAAGFMLVHRGKFENLAPQIDRVRDGLPFKLVDSHFDDGIWTLGLDAPAPTGEVKNILPGQGLILEKDKDDEGQADDHKPGKVSDPPRPPADPKQPQTSKPSKPGSGASSKVSTALGPPDAMDRYIEFRNDYFEKLTRDTRSAELVAPSNSTNPGMEPSNPDEPTELLVISKKAERNFNDLSQSDAVRRVSIPKTRGLNDLDQITREIKAQDPSVTAVIPNYPIAPFAEQASLLQPVQWALKNPVAPEIDTGWAEVRDQIDPDSIPLIGVVDAGAHTDDDRVQAFAWVNAKEIAGNGKDDDNNGLVDDYYGYHFANRTSTMFQRGVDNHGTYCASIIAGQPTGSPFDVLGVAPGARVIHAGALGQNSDIDTLAKALRYAAANGAKVINLSLGTPQDRHKNTAADVEGWNSHPIWDELENQWKVLLVISAGNDALNTDEYPALPACLPRSNIISVMAIDPAGVAGRSTNKKQYSNYGRNSIDIAAPGSQVMGINKTKDFAFWNGTSMAAPVVTGAAALVWAKHPDWDYAMVKRALLESGRPVEGLEQRCRTGRMVDIPAALAWTPNGEPAAGKDAGTTPPGKPNRNGNVAVVVGVNDLLNYPPKADLQGCVNDAHSMRTILTRFGGFQEDRVALLVDGYNNGRDTPTRKRILDAIEQAAKTAGPDDALIVSFAAHGTMSVSEDGRPMTLVLPSDYDANRSEETGVNISQVRQIIESSKAREKVLFLDVCHAGGTSELPPITTPKAFEGDGMVTIASCTFDQTSLEDRSKAAGVFTHWVTRGLGGEARGDDGEVTVFELFQFVSRGVPRHAEQIEPGHKQTPVFYGVVRNDFAIVEFN